MTAGSERVGGTRQWLRGLEVFAGPLPDFDPDQAPADPVRLFLSWLVEAVADGVRDPHAMMLSTVDSAGDPDARVLILKGVGSSGWQFGARRSLAILCGEGEIVPRWRGQVYHGSAFDDSDRY